MDVKFLVTVDAAEGIKAVKVFDDTLDHIAKTSETTEKAHKGLWAQVAVGEFAYNAARKAGNFFLDFLKGSITAAGDAEKANKGLDAALEITGRNVPGLAQHFKDYADELMRQTIYDDEAIKGAQALLVQLTNLDKNGIDKATKGAIGLASVFGMDLESAAQLVAKSMNGNVALLGRYGIKVEETTDKEKQRAQILDKLNQFYGRATAETETHAGKIEQLKVRYSEMQEAAGNALLKGMEPLMRAMSDPAAMAGIEKLTTGFMKLLAKVAEGYGYLAEMIAYLGHSEKNEAQVAIETSAKIATSYIERRDKLIAMGASYKDISEGMQDFSRDATGAVVDEGLAFEKLLQAVKKGDPYYKNLQDAVGKYTIANRASADIENKAAAALQKTHTQIEANTKGTNKFGDATVDAAKAQEKQNKAIAAFETASKKADKVLEDWTKDVTKAGKAGDGFNSSLEISKRDMDQGGLAAQWLAQNLDRLGTKSNQVAKDMPAKWQEAFIKMQANYSAYADAFQTIAGGISNLMNAQLQQKQSTLDKEKEAQRIFIEQTITDETKKKIALANLDAEYNAKGEAAQAAAGKKQKAIAYLTAVVGTAQAVVNGLATVPFIPTGLAAAATAAIMGAIQLATIKATPLAKGAIFKQPTLLPGMNGRGYQVAEAGEHEVVAPLSGLRKELGLDKGGRGNKYSITIPVYIGTQKIQTIVVKLVEDAAQIGKLRLAGKAVQ